MVEGDGDGGGKRGDGERWEKGRNSNKELLCFFF